MSLRVALLDDLASGPVSGPELAEAFDISRTAVWNHIADLRSAGFTIEAGSNGYRVTEVPEYGGDAIQFGLDAPYRIEYHDTIASTNERARELAGSDRRDIVVVADRQTGGRGRRDRRWVGPSGGIYLSLVFSPSIPPARVPLLTLAGGVAVARALDPITIETGIKWPNDLLVRGSDEKIAGILTEMQGESDRVEWVILGIGINANVDAGKLPTGATSLQTTCGPVDRRSIVQRLLASFHRLSADPAGVIEEWRSRTTTLDRPVRVTVAGEEIRGMAMDVDRTGALLIERPNGTMRRVHAGDCEHLRPIE